MNNYLYCMFWRGTYLVSSLVPLHGIFYSCIQNGLPSRAFGEAAFAPMTAQIILGCKWCPLCVWHFQHGWSPPCQAPCLVLLTVLPSAQHHSSFLASRGLELCKSLLTLKLVPKKTAVWPHAGLDLAWKAPVQAERAKSMLEQVWR